MQFLEISLCLSLITYLLVASKDNIKRINEQKLFIREKNFDTESLVAEVINTNWKSVLDIEKGNPNLTFENYNKKMQEIINAYLPLKKLSKKEFKIQVKPWITNVIRSSIKRRDKLLRKFIKPKDEVLKDELYSTYKTLRNKIVSLTRVGKKLHFQKYFTENCKDIKKTWSGIKNVINIHNSSKGLPRSILIDGEISNDPNKIANGFNYYFSNVAEKLQGKIHSFGNEFSKFLKTPNDNFFLFESADSQEILLIIDSLDNNKSSGPNSIPTDVLKLIKNNMSPFKRNH